MSVSTQGFLLICNNTLRYNSSIEHVNVSGELMFLNEATLLNNILTRYKKKKIYVSNSSHVHEFAKLAGD